MTEPAVTRNPWALTWTLGMCAMIISVGLLVIGSNLLTTCATKIASVSFGSTTGGCNYPFQIYGMFFIYLAALVVILAANLLGRSLESPTPPKSTLDRRYMLSVALAGGVTVLFLLFATAAL